jgi:hypothetical protein
LIKSLKRHSEENDLFLCKKIIYSFNNWNQTNFKNLNVANTVNMNESLVYAQLSELNLNIKLFDN